MPALFPAALCGREKDASDPSADQSSSIPEDELTESIVQLDDFDKLLGALTGVIGKIEEAARLLDEVSPKLLEECVPSLHGTGVDASLLPSFAAEITACGKRLQDGLAHVEKMSKCLADASEGSAAVRQAVAARDRAWPPKEEADRKVGKLTLPGRTYSIPEKQKRLKAKAAADEEFQRTTSEAKEAMAAHLAKRWTTTASVLSGFSCMVATVFRDSRPMVETCDKLSTKFLSQPETITPEVESTMSRASASLPPAPTTATAPAEGVPTVSEGQHVEVESTMSLAGASLPPAPTTATAPARGVPTFSEGQPVEVWSSGSKSWVNGTVEKVFREGDVDAYDGKRYEVPAGCVRVQHGTGCKYIKPDEVATMLRPRPE